MTNRKPTSDLPTNVVDWDTPEMQSLLNKTMSWQLENRGSFSLCPVDIHLGWSTDISQPATLLMERGNVMVIETSFPIPPGENLKVDKPSGDDLPLRFWGTVIESRPGNRAGDDAKNTHIHWVQGR